MLKMKLEGRRWVKHWSGGWSLLSCSYFGEQYTSTVKVLLGTSIPHAVLVSRKGLGACYFQKDELDGFGNALAGKVAEDYRIAGKWCRSLKKETDRILGMIRKLEGKDVDAKQYGEFLGALYAYVCPHIAVKKVVDYLPQELLKELLPQLEDARLYAEPVYTRSEEFMRAFAEGVAEKTGCSPEPVLCSTKEEIREYFKSGKLPSKEKLSQRFKSSALLYTEGKYNLLVGTDADEAEATILESTSKGNELVTGTEADETEAAILESSSSKNELVGKTAFPGRAKGIARIVSDPRRVKAFNDGDVLVAGMTRPEFIPLMKKASAVVTDAGGVLCHAAIVCRELRKPCVVGTEKATKIFKDGDVVEVDATKGTVRKLSQKE